MVLLFVNSCKKENRTAEENRIENPAMQKLATWYDTNVKIAEDNPFSALKPIWGKVHVGKQAYQNVYEILLRNPERLMVATGNIDRSKLDQQEQTHNIRLLIFENTLTGKIQYGCYMSVEIADDKTSSTMHYKNVGNSTGTVLYYTMGGNLANGWTYTEGKLVDQISVITKQQYEAQLQGNSITVKGKVMAAVYECRSGWAQKFKLTCVSAGENSPATCSWSPAGMDYVTQCAWVEQETIDHIAPPEIEGGYLTPIYLDCADIANGTATWNYSCNTCIGGTTGLTECPPREIKDSVQNTCIKAQLNLARTAKTSILSMMNNTFGGTVQFEDLDLVIRDPTNLADTIDGEMQRLSGIEFEIRLNQNKLPNSSKEYILSTIYHEILHALMESKLVKGSDGRYIITDQHQQMATDYVTLMSGALQIAFPGLSNNDAWALSWGGLQETPFYTTKLTDAQRTQITSINNRHKNKLANDKLGTYCN